MNRLERIELGGFKSIREMDLSLRQINVVLGANGAGKTNLLSFFRMLDFSMTGGLQTYISRSGGANSLLHYGARRTPQIEATMHFVTVGGINTYGLRLAWASPDTLVFTHEGVTFFRPGKGYPKPKVLNLDVGHKESRLKEVAEKGDSTAAVIRHTLSACRAFQFHDTLESSRIRGKGYIRDNRYLMSDAGNLAAFLYMLRETRAPYYARILDTIRDVAPQFGDFDLAPDRLEPTTILLNWREAESDYLFGPHQLPDGLLRFMALATLLLQPEDDLPNVVILDEPELGLHPYAINVLGGLIRKASVYSQIILATQSVNLVDQFQPDEIITVERERSASVFRRLDPSQLADWLAQYSLSELWEKNVIGGRPTR